MKLTSNHFRNSSLGAFNNKEYSSSYLHNNNNKTKLLLPLQMPSSSINMNHHIQRSTKIMFDNLFLVNNSVKTPHTNKLLLNQYHDIIANNSSSLTNVQIQNNNNSNNGNSKLNNVLYNNKQQEHFPLIKVNKFVNGNLFEQKVKNNIHQRGNHSQDSFSFINKQYQSYCNSRRSLRKTKLNEFSYRDNNKKNSQEKQKIVRKDSKDELMKRKDDIMVGGGGDDMNDSFYNEVQELFKNVNPKNNNEVKDSNESKGVVIEPDKNEIKKWKSIKRPETSYGDLNTRNNNLNTVLKSAKIRNNNCFMEKNNLNNLK